jgi:hypothetical protein
LPELFQVVVLAHGGLHDVNDDVAEVNQHPFTGVFTFHRNQFATGFAGFFGDIAGERPDLTVGIAGGDHDAVKHRGNLGGIDHLNVFAFDIFKGGNDNFLQLTDVHQELEPISIELVGLNIVENAIRQQIAR